MARQGGSARDKRPAPSPGQEESPTPKRPRNKLPSAGQSHSPPDFMSYLPENLLDRITSAMTPEEFKKYLRMIVAILFFKVRPIPESWIAPLLTVCIPQKLSHQAEAFFDHLKRLNQSLIDILTNKHRHYAQTLVESFGEPKAKEMHDQAAEQRRQKVKIARPFEDKKAVQQYMTLTPRDVIDLWSTILWFIDSDYVDNPDRFSDQWLNYLEEASYSIISRIASGIITAANNYSEQAMQKDIKSTSDPNLSFDWPEFTLPFNHIALPGRWGELSDCWPRGGHDSTVNKKMLNAKPVQLSSSPIRHDVEGLDASISEKAMTTAQKVHDIEESLDKEMMAQVIDMPGFRITYQYDPEYITAESSRIAQLNTSGLTLYVLERLQARAQTLKHFLVVADKRLQDAREALAMVQEDEERNRKVEARYQQIMEQAISIEEEVGSRRVAVEKDKQLFNSAQGRVRSGANSWSSGGLSTALASRRGGVSRQAEPTRPGAENKRSDYPRQKLDLSRPPTDRRFQASEYRQLPENGPRDANRQATPFSRPGSSSHLAQHIPSTPPGQPDFTPVSRIQIDRDTPVMDNQFSNIDNMPELEQPSQPLLTPHQSSSKSGPPGDTDMLEDDDLYSQPQYRTKVSYAVVDSEDEEDGENPAEKFT